MLVVDTWGSTLSGAIDGVNQAYYTSLDFDADSVCVYVNGRMKDLSPEYLDGAEVIGPRGIFMREALIEGDTIAVAYQLAGQASLGGAPDVGQAAVMVDTRADASPELHVYVPEPPRVRVKTPSCP